MKSYLSRDTNGHLLLTQEEPTLYKYDDGTCLWSANDDNELIINEAFLKGEFKNVTLENSPVEIEIKLK